MSIADTEAPEGQPLSVPVPIEVALPAPGDELDQHEEWIVARTEQGWRKIRLHDYASVFSVPGLYERWVYDILKCTSPARVRELLAKAVADAGESTTSLRVMDLGAGNGCVAEEFSALRVEAIVGVDIHQEAADAAERDRPGLYTDYVVGDLTDLDAPSRATLEGSGLNCLTCVAALGFGDIPARVFAAAFNTIAEAGWVAFTIKADFLESTDESGFAALIRRMLDEGVLDVAAESSYVHRVSTDGEELIYKAFVGRKRDAIPASWLA